MRYVKRNDLASARFGAVHRAERNLTLRQEQGVVGLEFGMQNSRPGWAAKPRIFRKEWVSDFAGRGCGKGALSARFSSDDWMLRQRLSGIWKGCRSNLLRHLA